MRRHLRARRTAAVDPEVALGPLVLPNPIVAASGTFGHGDDVARLCPPDRLGAVTAKSVAPHAWPGNAPPRLHPAPGGGMLNSVGLQGPGVEAWVATELPALVARGARVIASLWGHSVEDFALGAKQLGPARDDLVAVEVNVSCPNLEAGARMFAHDPAATHAATRAVVDTVLGLPVFVKLSPNTDAVVEVAGAALGAGATGLTLVNTLVGLDIDPDRRRATLGAGTGGLSGPPLRPVALRVVRDVHRAHPAAPIVGTGGVASGRHAVAMLLAGASAVGVGTATFRDPRAPLRVLDGLLAWCTDHAMTRVADLIGGLGDGR